ncbi:AfsR/SARP family transcriptional regulator [Streptomyces sp. NPDC093094]|uniref:AfsR/SARP family transcriptional regulator n=1 Tax=Streptomyces sp. NPDC093094 TaxID=3366026 RepID=UPI00380248A8
MKMRFALLGPLAVGDGQDNDLTPPSPKPKVLLAALLLSPNRVISMDRLADTVWDGRPPASARASLHNHVTRLRRCLKDASRVRSRDGGLVLQVEADELDADRFLRALDEAQHARDAEDWAQVGRTTEAALALWRGTPLAEFPALAARAASEVARWQEARLQCLELWFDAGARLGRHTEQLPELRRLTSEFPFRESFHSHLLLALHRTGRRAEALEAYHALRRTLADSLGIEPGPGVRSAFQHVLENAAPGAPGAPAGGGAPSSSPPAASGAPSSSPPAASGAPSSPPPAVPVTLPRDPVGFAGRDSLLHGLLTELKEDGDRAVPEVRVHAIDGMPGVGKTAFALRIAHQVRADYPDGQIFLPLHAHTAGTSPVAPEDALAELLLAAGENPQRIPAGLDARAGAWRSRVAGRRMLVVLDDAASSDQVEALLPGTPGCLVLVTSRRRLEALTGARPLTLDILSEDEAVRLLLARSGRRDITSHDPALVRLAGMCGHLPLALHLVAARLRHRPQWTPADLAEDLASAASRPAALAAENVSVAAAFDLSCRSLSEAARTLLRLVGLLPGTDLDPFAAAALYGCDLATARRLLDELCDQHLLDEPSPRRFQTHDLVREYAQALSRDGDPAAGDAAVRRLLAHYLHTAMEASRHLARHRAAPPALTLARPASLPAFADEYEATAWLNTEHANLRAAVAHASRHGMDEVTVYLPTALHDFLRSSGHWDEAQALHRVARTAARNAGDRLGEAVSLHHLSLVDALKGRYERAEAGLREALGLIRPLKDPAREGLILEGLGRVLRLTGRYEESITTLTEALRRLGDSSDRLGEASARIELGHVLQLTGRFAEAAAALGETLAVLRGSGDRRGLANALTTLADVYRSLGRYADSVEHHRQALGLFRGLGNRLGEANVLADLGDVLRLTGAHGQAAEVLTDAVRKYHELGSRLGTAHALTYLSRVQLRCGEVGEAKRNLERALAICDELNSAMGQAYSRLHLAEAAHRQGDHGRAEKAAEDCVVRFRDLGDLGGEVAATHLRACALRAAGLPEQALTHHREALTLARRIQAPYEEMLALTGVADCLTDLGAVDEGLPHLRAALATAERLQVPEAHELRRRVATDRRGTARAGVPCTAPADEQSFPALGKAIGP